MSKTPRKNILPIAFLLGGTMLLKYAAARRGNAVGKVGSLHPKEQLLYETPSPYEFVEDLPANPELLDLPERGDYSTIYRFQIPPERLDIFSTLLGVEVSGITMSARAAWHAVHKHGFRTAQDIDFPVLDTDIERIESLLQSGDIFSDRKRPNNLIIAMQSRDRRKTALMAAGKYAPETKELRLVTFFCTKIVL